MQGEGHRRPKTRSPEASTGKNPSMKTPCHLGGPRRPPRQVPRHHEVRLLEIIICSILMFIRSLADPAVPCVPKSCQTRKDSSSVPGSRQHPLSARGTAAAPHGSKFLLEKLKCTKAKTRNVEMSCPSFRYSWALQSGTFMGF